MNLWNVFPKLIIYNVFQKRSKYIINYNVSPNILMECLGKQTDGMFSCTQQKSKGKLSAIPYVYSRITGFNNIGGHQ
mgnify:CR=1 FL=1